MGLLNSVTRIFGSSTKAPEAAFERVPPTWMQPHTLRGSEHGEGQDVVGESNYVSALVDLARGRTEDGPYVTLHTAQLIRDPRNQYDKQAIRVEIGGQLVGYVPRAETPVWHPVIAHLACHGQPATCFAKFTGGWDRGGGDTGHIGVKLRSDAELADAHQPVLCRSARRVALSGEQHHQDALAALASTTYTAQLAGEDGVITVWVSGHKVGQLTPKMSDRYMGLITAVHTAGLPVTCFATAEQGKNKIEAHLLIHPPWDIDQGIPTVR